MCQNHKHIGFIPSPLSEWVLTITSDDGWKFLGRKQVAT